MEYINDYVRHFINQPIRKDLTEEDHKLCEKHLTRWLTKRGLPLSSTETFELGRMNEKIGVFYMKNGNWYNFLVFLSKQHELVALSITESKKMTFVYYETSYTTIRSFVAGENLMNLTEAIIASPVILAELKTLRTKIASLKTWSTTYNSITFSFKNGSEFTLKLIFGELFFCEGSRTVEFASYFGSVARFVEYMNSYGGKFTMSDTDAADALMSLSSN